MVSYNGSTPREDSVSPASGLSILLVEDVAANRKMVARILESRGHRVTAAQSGVESLKEFAAGRFDVILMDIEMPGMDGYEAAAAIRCREAGSGCHTPIVALTAHATAEERRRCILAGMDAHVAKPIDVNVLIRLLEESGRAALPTVIACHGPPSPAERQARQRQRGSQCTERAIDCAATINRLGGDLDLFQNFIEVFNEDSPQLAASIKAAVAAGDWSAVRRAAHALHGLAANFDAKKLTAIACRLERLGVEEPPESAATLSAAICREVACVRRALAAHRRR
jgi:two-component system, sensor histidine kinase and response regulator